MFTEMLHNSFWLKPTYNGRRGVRHLGKARGTRLGEPVTVLGRWARSTATNVGTACHSWSGGHVGSRRRLTRELEVRKVRRTAR